MALSVRDRLNRYHQLASRLPPSLVKQPWGIHFDGKDMKVTVYYSTSNGQQGKLSEPETDFPSDALIGQLILVLS